MNAPVPHHKRSPLEAKLVESQSRIVISSISPSLVAQALTNIASTAIEAYQHGLSVETTRLECGRDVHLGYLWSLTTMHELKLRYQDRSERIDITGRVIDSLLAAGDRERATQLCEQLLNMN